MSVKFIDQLPDNARVLGRAGKVLNMELIEEKLRSSQGKWALLEGYEYRFDHPFSAYCVKKKTRKFFQFARSRLETKKFSHYARYIGES